MKKRVVVLISSIVALVLAAYFVLAPQPADVASHVAAAPDTSSAPAPTPATPTRDEAVEPRSAKPQEVTSPSGPEPRPNVQNAPSSAARSTPITPPPQDNDPQMAACNAIWEKRRERERAARDAETKDAAWAYATEQKLREWASRRLQAASIELIAVDCKTTYCDLVAQPFEPESANEFGRALQDVQKEPWSDFGGHAMSSSTETGKVTYRGELRRRKSYLTAFEAQGEDEAEVACMQLVNRRYQQERATQDAEARDAAWADRTEQLLRQHIVSRLAKHPLKQLDIDCKATFCRIKADGLTDASISAFQRPAEEAAKEPWANLRVGGGGSSGYGDRWTADITLHRQ
jgi:hypothetical protein